MKIKRVFLISVLTSLYLTFSVFGAREGMVAGPYRGDPETTSTYIYYNSDGSYVKNEWKQVWDNWYYFDADGVTKQNTWAEINGSWYYFNEWSVMLSNTTTPDGYHVNSSGVWENSTTSASAATSQNVQKNVWISKTGSKYHYDSTCSNMKNPSQLTLEQAVASGYGACEKCAY